MGGHVERRQASLHLFPTNNLSVVSDVAEGLCLDLAVKAWSAEIGSHFGNYSNGHANSCP